MNFKLNRQNKCGWLRSMLSCYGNISLFALQQYLLNRLVIVSSILECHSNTIKLSVDLLISFQECDDISYSPEKY